MIRAVFFDIDGTLLTRQGTIRKSTMQAMHSLQEQGILCCLATGRSPVKMPHPLNKFSFDAVISFNGTLVSFLIVLTARRCFIPKIRNTEALRSDLVIRIILRSY